MKITKQYLKQIIKEEIERISEEERKQVNVDGTIYNVVVDGGDLLMASGPTGPVNDAAVKAKIKNALGLR